MCLKRNAINRFRNVSIDALRIILFGFFLVPCVYNVTNIACNILHNIYD